MQINGKYILIHVLGCLAFLTFPIVFSPDFVDVQRLIHADFFQRDFSVTVLLLVFFYANYYYFTPRFYIPKKYVSYLVIIVVCYLVIMLLPELLMDHGPKPRGPHGFRPPRRFPLFFLLNHNFLQFIIVLIFSLLLKIRERLKQIETEKANAELSYLKAQINPHFLFNTLNSIYSLAILKNEKTADAVVKLSDMMRYVLNDSNANFVVLEKELNYISNYIELQRMRLTSNVKLTYVCEGSVIDKKIAPLVLIPFIENAFKHGVNSEENSAIDIHISISETELKLQVKNNCVSTNNNTLNKSGLGIENTRQRLNLLYPQNYTLNIIEKDSMFTVILVLNIHD
jgi:hypothetical protein